MINVVTGKLGSGKTYWAVQYLVKKHLIYDEDILTWVTRAPVRIITNIEGLKLPHHNLQDEINEHGLKRVFSKEYCDEFRGSTVYLIDEAQNIFDRNFKDKDVLYFLQTSRHYGCDIILITQDISVLALPVRVLCEYEIYSVERTARLGNVFMYRYKLGDEIFKKKSIKFDLQVASLYKSFHAIEADAPKSALTRFALIGVALAVSLGLVFWFGVRTMYAGAGIDTQKRIAKATKQNYVAPTPPGGTEPRRPAQRANVQFGVEEVKKEVEKMNKELNNPEKERIDSEDEGEILRSMRTVKGKDEKGREVTEMWEGGRLAGRVRVVK